MLIRAQKLPDETLIRRQLLGRKCPECGHYLHAHDQKGCLAVTRKGFPDHEFATCTCQRGFRG